MGAVDYSPDHEGKRPIPVGKIRGDFADSPGPKIEMPPDGRRLTIRESMHIRSIVEIHMERDSAFLFNLAQAIVLQAKRKRARGE